MGSVYIIPASVNIFCTSLNASGSTAINKPPLVCGSGKIKLASFSSMLASNSMPSKVAFQFLAVAPGIAFVIKTDNHL